MASVAVAAAAVAVVSVAVAALDAVALRLVSNLRVVMPRPSTACSTRIHDTIIEWVSPAAAGEQRSE